MPKGVYKRKKAGRPKGSKNKKFSMAGLTNYDPSTPVEVGQLEVKTPWIAAIGAPSTEPPSFLSRLEAATVKYEQAIKEAIEALKGN